MQSLFTEMEQNLDSFSRIIFSSPKEKSEEKPDKIILQKSLSKNGKASFSLETCINNKALRKPVGQDKILSFAKSTMEERNWRQVNLFLLDAEISYRISKKGKVSRSVNRKAALPAVKEGHNREKNYLIRRVELYYYGNQPIYQWGLCVEKGVNDIWGSQS